MLRHKFNRVSSWVGGDAILLTLLAVLLVGGGLQPAALGTEGITNAGNRSLRDTELGWIAAIKYGDVNGNGVPDYPDGEPRLDGWIMTLYDDQSNAITTGTTGAHGTGRVEFHDLPAGTYTVCETMQAGWINTEPSADVCRTVQVRDGKKTVARFGNRKLGWIAAVKYEDVNANGVPDYPQEPRLDGWEMMLYDDQDNEIALGTTGVNGTGRVEFYLEEGTYTVCEVLQAGWVNTEPGGDACRTVNVRWGDKTVARFGNRKGGSITIVKDAIPADGKDFDFYGELGGFTLDDAAPDDLDANSNSITFSGLAAGDYTVAELLPRGWFLEDVVCIGGDSDPAPDGVTIHLDSSEDITCTFSNCDAGERAHPGWGSEGFKLALTGNQPAYWSAHSGDPGPGGVSAGRWTMLDPGDPPG
ncbi:MAG: hypothetical protein GY842_08960, partial [bacterium]|nr:hypothetical protein [bacterium]